MLLYGLVHSCSVGVVNGWARVGTNGGVPGIRVCCLLVCGLPPCCEIFAVNEVGVGCGVGDGDAGEGVDRYGAEAAIHPPKVGEDA